MNPPAVPPDRERREQSRRLSDLESIVHSMAPMVEQTKTFREKVERALFDDEGHSRIRMMEVHYDKIERALFDEKKESRLSVIDKIERALFDEKNESRIALMEVNMRTLMQFLDRSKFLTRVLWVGWIGFGGLLGWIVDLFWLKR